MGLCSKEKLYGCPFCDDPWDDNSPRGVKSFNSKGGLECSELSVWTCVNGHVEGTWEIEKNGKKRIKKFKFKYLHPHAISELIWATERFFKNVNKWRRWKGPK
jgi:hypothetical protein